MNFANVVRFAVQSTLRGRIRVILTVVAIAVSVGSIMLIRMLGDAGVSVVNQELDKIGFESLAVFGSNEKSKLSEDDADVIRENVGVVSAASPIVMEYGSYKLKGTTGTSVLWGVDSDVTSVMDIRLLFGRILSKNDINSSTNLAIVDSELAKKLYSRENIVGKKIVLSVSGIDKTFEIIGVVSPQKDAINQLVGGSIPDFIYLPYTTLNQMRGKNDITQIAVRCFDPNDFPKAEHEIVTLLERRKKGEYQAENIAEYVNGFRSATSIIGLVIAAIAAISLCVAGLGIMNTMLATVNERKKEIGICMAIGAKERDIVMCFMCEGAIISALGGLIGGTVGILLSYILLNNILSAVSLNFGLFFQIELLTVILGILFSVIPAIRASKLDPIQALRSE
ncbi:MAG: FtsX-like permease family protein [Ruminococcaceae bacterium]|nr:FtsX-like permease family protein [Oscillospiraceae bacterium]